MIHGKISHNHCWVENACIGCNVRFPKIVPNGDMVLWHTHTHTHTIIHTHKHKHTVIHLWQQNSTTKIKFKKQVKGGDFKQLKSAKSSWWLRDGSKVVDYNLLILYEKAHFILFSNLIFTIAVYLKVHYCKIIYIHFFIQCYIHSFLGESMLECHLLAIFPVSSE